MSVATSYRVALQITFGAWRTLWHYGRAKSEGGKSSVVRIVRSNMIYVKTILAGMAAFILCAILAVVLRSIVLNWDAPSGTTIG